MSSRRNLQDWKDILIGNTYNSLTVVDVIKDNNSVMCICKCVCGNVKHAEPSRVFNGKLKSCGCLNNKENLSFRMKRWYADNPDKAKEKSEKVSKWYRTHPDKVAEYSKAKSERAANNKDLLKETGKKISQWYKNNPDKVKEKSEKLSQWFKNNPDKVAARSEKYSQWCKDNPDKVKEMITKSVNTRANHEDIGKSQREFWKTHPDKLEARTNKLREYYQNNPDKVQETGTKISEWCKNNPEKVKARAELCKQTWAINKEVNSVSLRNAHIINRIKSIENVDLSIVHPDDVVLLKSGFRSDIKIRTKCPLCGNYSYHAAYQVISYGTHEIRPRYCSRCSKSFTSSKYEQEIADFISTFYNGECIKNSRDIISPLELDLYYPEKKIAIEFNGDYWHDENHKPKDYHYNKFKQCLDKNILLVSIFESEWNYRKEEIKQYIKNTFDGISCSISFKEDLMNNNYPSYGYVSKIGEYIEDAYLVNKTQVFTCGYSTIII